MIKNSLGSQARFLFGAKILAFVFQFLIPVVLSRLFTVEDYGVYRQVILFAMIFPAIFSLGIEHSLYYFYPIAKDKINKGRLVMQSLFVLLTSAVVFLILFYFLHSFIYSFWKDSAQIANYSLPLALYVMFMIPALLLENLIIVEQNSKRVIYYTLINGITRFAIIVLVAWLLESIMMQIWALVSFEALRTFFVFIYARQKYYVNLGFIKWINIKLQMKYSVPLGMGNAIGGFGGKMESYMLLLFLSPAQFAIYSIANFRLPYVNLLYSAVANVALIRISEYSVEKQYKESRTLWHKAIINQAVITFSSVFFFIIMAPSFIEFVFSEKYLSSVPYFQIILLAPMAQVFSAGIILRAYNYTNYTLIIKIIVLFVALINAYFLVKYYGLFGASISAVITFYITVLLEIIMASRILKLNVVQTLPYKKLFITVLISILAALPLYYINQAPWFNIIKLGVAAGLYFGFVLLIFHKLKYIDLSPIYRPILKYMFKVIGNK